MVFTPSTFSDNARKLRLDTLVRLRWLAVFGQSLAVAFVYIGLEFPLPFALCFLVIGVSATLNLVLRIAFPATLRLNDKASTGLLAFDVLQLAALLYLTGGLHNPFALLFLAPVMISATALPPVSTVSLGALALGSASLITVFHYPLPWWPGEVLALPLLYTGGLWLALFAGIAFTATYAWRVAAEARQLAQALAATELVLARQQHLSQIDGLAAAAAHELGTPLGTIALVAKELQNQPLPALAQEDIALLREQVERCRTILGKLTSLHQEGGDFFGVQPLSQILQEVIAPHNQVHISLSGEGEEPLCQRTPGLLYGLSNLVDNAVDFAESRVDITGHWTPQEVRVEITDDGPGFAPEVLLHGGEPYVTTRGQDKRGLDTPVGHGLGLFIAKTLIERTGGRLILGNAQKPQTGAYIQILWPRSAFEPSGTAMQSG